MKKNRYPTDAETGVVSGQELRAALGSAYAGDVLTGMAERQAYATDASLYQRLPAAIACPRSVADCASLASAAQRGGWTLTPRGAGTSLAGQAIGAGVIVDTSRYMDRLAAVDVANRWADVEPGLVLDQLNAAVRSHGLQFGPDPSTFNRCTFGGVIGNNAWGAHAPRDGTTRDHVERVDLVLSDGSQLNCGPLSAGELNTLLDRTDRVGQLYRTVIDEIAAHRRAILHHYPDPNRVPCNTGYALHVLARMQPFDPHGSPFNLAALVCGSEGTLGLIARARVRLTKRPAYHAIIAAHYHNIADALDAVVPARAHGASAIELLDSVIIELTEHNLLQRKHRHWIVGAPRAVVIVEFDGSDRATVDATAAALQSQLVANGAYAAPMLTAPNTDDVWAVRRAGLGLLMGIPGANKPVTLIEDSAVPVEQLGAFYHDVERFMARIGKQCVYYGSVGMGLIHLRPLLNIGNTVDRALLDTIMTEVAGMLRHYGGALSAKHGDGRLRGPYLRAMLGDEVADCIGRVKHAFDPQNTMNPGVIVSNDAVTAHLRPHIEKSALSTNRVLSPFAASAALQPAEHCHGAGVCRRPTGEGAMCPSYRAAHEELTSTRARANVLRNMLVRDGVVGLGADEVHEALDLCLACKACRRECPANVDMARAKTAHLQARHVERGIPLRSRVFAGLDWYARMMGRMPEAWRGRFDADWIKRIVGIHPARHLPQPVTQRFSAWFAQRSPAIAESSVRVVLLNDVFTEYFDTHIGIAATRVFEAMGAKVTLAPCVGSPRAALSQGLIEIASRRLREQAAWLRLNLRDGDVVVGLEPSELLTWRDEAAELGRDAAERDEFSTLGKRVVLVEEAIEQLGGQWMSQLKANIPRRVWVHVHCHQKSLSDATLVENVLARIGNLSIKTIASGCCGMAGAFGYEHEHYALSQSVAELVLLPTLRGAGEEDWIVATGASCRQQIADGLKRRAMHVSEVIAACLP